LLCHQDYRSGLFSAVLRDCSLLLCHPRLPSWGILSRPFGTVPCCCAIRTIVLGYSQPSFGTVPCCCATQDYRPGLFSAVLRDCSLLLCHQDYRPGVFSAVPSGLFLVVVPARTTVLGYSQLSLRDCSLLLCHPGLSSWAILSLPFGTVPCCCATRDYRPGLFSAVPLGLFLVVVPPRTTVLGYSQPSLRDCSLLVVPRRTIVLGYSQPSLRDCSLLLCHPGLSFWAILSRPSGLFATTFFTRYGLLSSFCAGC
jgi:hypothetical protein